MEGALLISRTQLRSIAGLLKGAGGVWSSEAERVVSWVERAYSGDAGLFQGAGGL
jgi:hypothetical protein